MPRLPTLLAAAALVALAAPAAQAQSSGERGSGSDSDWMEMDDGDSGRWSDGDRDGSWRGHHHRWAGRDRDGDRRRGDGRDDKMKDGPMSRFGGGARFMLRSGDVRLDVLWGRGETMKDCVDATILLMDKARSQAGSSAGSDTAPSSPNPPATSPQQP
jgi:hypothetical protein